MEKRIILSLILVAGMFFGAQAYDTAGGDFAARKAFVESGNARVARPSTNPVVTQKQAVARPNAQQVTKQVVVNQSFNRNKFSF